MHKQTHYAAASRHARDIIIDRECAKLVAQQAAKKAAR